VWARRNISEFGSLAPRRTSSSAKSTSYQRHLNRGGIVHGGALLAFADDLGGTVARLNVPDGFRTTTIARRREFLSPRAREEPILPDVQNGARITIQRPETDAICSRRGGRLVQWTAGRRRSRRDSRLIVKTSPRFAVNWPALASSILEDSGPVFTNRRCGAISPVRSVPDPPASTAPRAREEIKTHEWIPIEADQPYDVQALPWLQSMRSMSAAKSLYRSPGLWVAERIAAVASRCWSSGSAAISALIESRCGGVRESPQ
jgi:hypothetical protein